MTSRLASLNEWVAQVAAHTKAHQVHWCDGSDAENRRLIDLMLDSGDLVRLNEKTHPNCYLHRSDPNDVARVEHLTYVCTQERADAGPNNHWMAPDEAHALMNGLFAGCMEGRTLYVVPYCMGPIDSPFSRCGVEITDSPYVVVNMRLMTRMGSEALARIERDGSFVKGLHSTGDLDPDRRYIMHFPEELSIQSFGSGYGGNALLGKKCHALRIASYQARSEGWLAEHMLIVGIENPAGEVRYVAAAFPSACGKTNMAMLIPPEPYREAGWKVWTLGDDICWLHPGDDGRLYAINPEAGLFGVAPGTSEATNPNALDMLNEGAIFTNVAVTDDNQPWWEGLDERVPARDWRGRDYDPRNGPAAHPNSRFTASIKSCPSYSSQAENPAGVPIDAIIFGGRRAQLAPLVLQARDWQHGVLIGAAMASETTAAAAGQVGVVRRDPMAMKPFAGYHFGDYWQHWLEVGKRLEQTPAIFQVNWFRRDEQGRFIWPGFGDNLRVLEWILARCRGEGSVVETPVGYLPELEAIDLTGLEERPDMATLLDFDADGWRKELTEMAAFFQDFEPRVPAELHRQLARASAALG
ncbi:phosphoenolpyruvate carboxykinase (GTP) [Wenzhouxiangella limi]|uniref:Phosphoenolpyruvate carboxykinase [GTP] n=1 Tax=Wenzhouxiangella limi TaxID=2707351 RepID=A0A845V5U9_9GAMM|nr:phosphoenolpyruvate carboxykinase (GTP) [Wenzhouxiangella limi]NDY95571.1 phosphoenolpyruvate carboxykinase (GTP) [Wenzhouxiangella limi]